MSWRSEWKAISDRIKGLLSAGQIYIECLRVNTSDPANVAREILFPNFQSILTALRAFSDAHAATLPSAASESIIRFLDAAPKRFNTNWPPGSDYFGVQSRLTALAAFEAEFSFHLVDVSAVARRLTERAFLHLRRSIVADDDIRQKWIRAFEANEPACEKLGSVHLLSHGIWAFKAGSAGERTDLLMGEPNLQEAASTAEALVLTEWKIVRNEGEKEAKIAEAKEQASRYRGGSLAGFELASYAYLVMVSADMLEMDRERTENGITYRLISIAVSPSTPSVAARRRSSVTSHARRRRS